MTNGLANGLWKKALKTAVSSGCGMIVGLNIVDPEHFSFTTFGGWKHLLLAIVISVVFAEARYWKDWADSSNGSGN